MRYKLIVFVCVFFLNNTTSAQQWLTNLEIAKNLALVQDKMILMVWEDATYYEYPVVYYNETGRRTFVRNLFTNETLSPVIWKYFVPVIVSESQYNKLYNKIKDKRSETYKNKFNDDSIKILDANGYILNLSSNLNDYQNISKIITQYGLDTSFISNELQNYNSEKNFYTCFFLASRYLDLALYSDIEIQDEVVNLSNIYLEEARGLIKTKNEESQIVLGRRCDLLKIQEYLILKRPRKAIRLLRRMDVEDFGESNLSLAAFLYYAAYGSLGDREKALAWKPQLSSVNLRKAHMLINLNS